MSSAVRPLSGYPSNPSRMSAGMPSTRLSPSRSGSLRGPGLEAGGGHHTLDDSSERGPCKSPGIAASV